MCFGLEPGGLQPSAPSFPSPGYALFPCQHSAFGSAVGFASAVLPLVAFEAFTGASAAASTGAASLDPAGPRWHRRPF